MLMANDSRPALALEIQNAVHEAGIARQAGVPAQQEFHGWVVAALKPANHRVEMVIRVVDEQESRQLNSRYRGQDKATNVLSFPFAAPAGIHSDHLGDLVICAAVVRREAQQQQKKEIDHWAHMVVHGVLHLRGLDHQTEGQAREMEELEKQILAGLGIRDPYQTKDVSI
jgi:probable rRNA maturation factor